jgi:hypothetical protein
MSEFEHKTKNILTPKEYLTWYKNEWTGRLVARTIDLNTDLLTVAVAPGKMVLHDNGAGMLQEIPVEDRLEARKQIVRDAIELLKSIDDLLALTPEDYHAKVLSDEALAPRVVVEEVKAAESPETVPASDEAVKDAEVVETAPDAQPAAPQAEAAPSTDAPTPEAAV